VSDVPEPIVATLAGNGRMRADDGDALGAAFLFPYGVAVAPDGSVYVSDAGAQAIRRIADGKVTFVAGNAPLGVTPQARKGGYVDGPAMAARFVWPTGLALAKDGSLFIADTGNHCIRRLQNGVVTTYAGARTPGNADGERLEARFALPQGLALDDDGNLYVADFGNGIRRITPAGVVSTLKQLRTKQGRVLGIDAKGAGPTLQIAYTEDDALHLWTPAGAQVVLASAKIEPVEDDLHAAGSFYGVTILGPKAVAVTDVLHNVVRFIRFGSKPFTTWPNSRIIAGAAREGNGAPGGYADGPPPASLVDIPLGIARMPDGNLVFTDAGNRRVRTISNVDPRGPVGPDLKGLYGPKDAYRITVIGDSFTFANVLWQESIAGRIETALKAANAAGKPIFVSTVRLDGVPISGQASFISEHLGDGQTDLVVMLIDDITQAHEMNRQDLRNGRWRTVTPGRLLALQRSLDQRGTHFMIVVIPAARSVSLNEVPEIGAFNDGQVTAVSFEQDNDRARQIADFYQRAGVHALVLLDSMEKFEATAGRISLYNMRDIHLSPQGSSFVGDRIAEEIERWQPWSPNALP
jgi:DNA-binding beta-propeller fold protein YncE